MSQQIPSDLIREVIREVLNDVVATQVRQVATTAVGSVAAADGAELVSIRSQSDLDAAVRRVLADAAHPARRAAVQSGRVRFVLGEVPAAGGGRASGATGPEVVRVERGALTERHVRTAGQNGAVIHITRAVVVTPLAKERARAMGVQIVKEG